MANKECSKCIHKEVCKTAESCDGFVSGCKHFDNGVVISNLETTTPTNADRIRAMSDEEIAQWLCLNYSCTKCLGQELCTINDGKANGLLKWLKQPADMRGEEDG